jgi:signal transduction histidine kinase
VEARLVQARRFEAVGRLAAGAAHDFGNVVTVVLAEAERLARSGDARTEASAAAIYSAAELGATLTRQLLAFGRRQVPAPELIELGDLIRRQSGLLRRFAGDDVRLDLLLAAELPPLRADRTELEQVLLSLVTNARDAMPHGGVVTISTGVATPELRARGGVGGQRRAVYMAVADTGLGIDDGVRARLFEPFFTTKEVGKGTGLGLSTVHDIISRAGGAIVVDSDLGRGTTFTALFPI